MKVKSQEIQSGHIYDGRQVLSVERSKPHVILNFTRDSGGGREVIWWDIDVWVEAQQLVDAGEIRKLFGVIGDED